MIAAPGRVRPGQPVDLLIEDGVQRVLDAANPDIIVNLAALTDVDYCETHPAEAYRVNAGLVLNLVRWIEAKGTHIRLVQASTDQIYDGAGPHRESDVCPTNFYGYSKCLAEEYVRRVGGLSLRTNFFGRSARADRASFSDWIVAALRTGKPITVFEDVLFSPLSLGTLVRSIERVMAGPISGVFNVGSRDGLSKADFAFHLAAAAGLPVKTMARGTIAARPQIARRPRDMRMDSRGIARLTGVPEVDLTTEIAMVAKGYKDEGS